MLFPLPGLNDDDQEVLAAIEEMRRKLRFQVQPSPSKHDVAVVGRIRRSRYEQAEGLTLQQAQRDLRDLTAAGLLEPVGRTRARYYTEGPRFPERVLEVARTPMTLSQPYPDALG